MKKAIAMRCSQEDWDSIKDKLDGIKQNIWGDFSQFSYITNFWGGEFQLGNCKRDHSRLSDCEIHETFNAKIFLDACGIETKPTLEEVKERFKDAETVEDYTGCIRKITFKNLEQTSRGDVVQDFEGENWLVLHYNGKYAKILTYKTPKYEITKQQIWDIDNFGYSKVREWFPEVFKKELVAGRWYKSFGENTGKLFCFNGDFDIDKDPKGYGFVNNNTWMQVDSIGWAGLFEEATPKEVETALQKEWEKRAKEYNFSCVDLDGESHTECGFFTEFIDGCLYMGSDKRQCVFRDGQFATIIPSKK